MFEQIKKLDEEFLLYINSHHNSFFDTLMWFASSITGWFPLYAFIIILLIVKFKRQSFLSIVLIIPLIFIGDQLIAEVVKPIAQRLRPSHEPGLENILHYVDNYRGGLYSFPSAHACNFFAWVTYICIISAKKIKWFPYLLIPVALLVSYSRIYLGVHYPSDILCGALLGMVIAWGFSRIYFRLNHSFSKNR
jgi:undecaprenyl-diphosphatase